MANQKITELNELFAQSASLDDLFVVVDVDEFSSPTGETMKMELDEVAKAVLATKPLVSGSAQVFFQGLGDVSGSISASANFFVKVNSTGNGVTYHESVETLQSNISQSSHGFVVGDAIRKTTTASIWALASSDTDVNAEALGLVSKVSDANNFVVVFRGLITTLNGLSEGGVYFLSTSSLGTAPFRNISTSDSTVPSISKPMYVAVSSTSAVLLNYRGSEIANIGGSGGGSSGGISEEISQTAHGFSVGDVLKRTVGAWALATAESDVNAESLGVVSVVPNANTFTIVYEGIIDTLSGLSDSSVYFLATSSAGPIPLRNVTLNQPVAPNISKPIYVATSTSSAIILTYRGAIVTTGSFSLSGSFLGDFSGSFTGSFTGSFHGDGTDVLGVISSSHAITSSYAAGLSNIFSSGLFALTASSQTIIPHTLGTTPILVQSFLKNISTDGGYVPGDLLTYYPSVNTNGSGSVVKIDSSNLTILNGNGIQLITSTSFSLFNIDFTKWQYSFKAWK